MKQNNRFCVLALTAVLALTLTACSETADGSAASGSTQTTQPAQSTAQQDTSAGTPSASQQTEVLGSLTSSELQELVSGSTTLEQLTQQRAEAADPGTGSTTAMRSRRRAWRRSPCSTAMCTWPRWLWAPTPLRPSRPSMIFL